MLTELNTNSSVDTQLLQEEFKLMNDILMTMNKSKRSVFRSSGIGICVGKDTKMIDAECNYVL